MKKDLFWGEPGTNDEVHIQYDESDNLYKTITGITLGGNLPNAIISLSKLTVKDRGQGQGVGGPRQGDGGADVCVCPNCGTTSPHKKGKPCNELECPKCGTPMVGKNKSENKKDKNLGSPNGCRLGQDFEEDRCLSEEDIAKIEKPEPSEFDVETMFCEKSNGWVHIKTNSLLAEKEEGLEKARDRFVSLKKAMLAEETKA